MNVNLGVYLGLACDPLAATNIITPDTPFSAAYQTVLCDLVLQFLLMRLQLLQNAELSCKSVYHTAVVQPC